MAKQKAFIAYRGNDLLDQDVPVIARALEEVGYDVRVQKFEKGTPENDIESWAQQNRADLIRCDLVLSDDTFKYSLPCGWQPGEDNFREEVSFPEDDPESLDELVNGVILEGVIGSGVTLGIDGINLKESVEGNTEEEREMEYERRELERTKQAYLSVLGKMQLPRKIYISHACLTSHRPFGKGNRGNEANKRAAEILVDWFREAGIAEVKVINNKRELPEEDKNQGNWYISDRHNLGGKPVKGYVTLQVPFTNFWQDLNEQGMIQGVDYSEKLAEYIKQRFQGEK